MATSAPTTKVSSVGLTAAQQANVQNIVNSNPGGGAAYAGGANGTIAPASQSQLNTIAQGSGYSGTPITSTGLTSETGVAPTINTPGSTVPTTTTPAVPNQAQANNTTDSGGQITSQGIPNSTGPTIPSTGNATQDIATQQKNALAALKQSGAPSPDSQGSASAAIDQVSKLGPQLAYTPTPEVQTQVDDSLSQYMQAVADYINPANQRQSLVDEYKQMSQSLGVDNLKTELLNVNRIMNGTEDDIRSEVTAAAGFATESQVQAMTIGRNKSLLKNAQFIQDQLTSAQNELGTMMNLSAQDRTYSENKMQSGLSLLGNVVQIQQSMKKAATDNYNNIVQNAGYDGLLKMTGGDPYNIAMTEKTLGLGAGGLQGLATQAAQQRAQKDQLTSLDIQGKQSQLKTDVMTRANIQSEINARNTSNNVGTVSVLNGSGQQINIPSNVAPYYDTSHSGVGYIDASTIQGTAAEKTAIVNAAQSAGLKVITNKNTAADISNIKDANNKLDTIQQIMTSLTPANPLQRVLNNPFTKGVSTYLQTDSQKAAAGSLQSVGLDMLKAISGVQGFRGNSTVVEQINSHLPTIYDTTATANQKVDYLRQLISDREDGLLGAQGNSQTSAPALIPATQVPTGYYQASDGLFYKK